MRTRWRILIICVVCVSAILRISVVWRHDTVVAGDGVAGEPNGAIGTPYCFDPDAPVLLGVGEDAAPGIAGWDDNLNGVIDERRELGAVGSDDVCLAPQDARYVDVREHSDTVVISRGAFVRCDEADRADRWLVDGWGWLVGKASQ